MELSLSANSAKTGHFEDVLPIKSVKKRTEEINLTKNNQGCINKQNIYKNLQSGLAASYNVQSCVLTSTWKSENIELNSQPQCPQRVNDHKK